MGDSGSVGAARDERPWGDGTDGAFAAPSCRPPARRRPGKVSERPSARDAARPRPDAARRARSAGSTLTRSPRPVRSREARRADRSAWGGADGPDHAARPFRGDGRRRPGGRGQLDAPPGRRAGEGARARPGRRLHREQVIDLLWPDDTLDEAVPKLHKAAHFARRAIGVPDAVVLRGDSVVLCPDADVTVDVVGSRSSPAGRSPTATPPRPARRSRSYGGELLPAGPLRGVGRGAAASSSACATSTCCASTAGGRRVVELDPPTSAPTSRYAPARRQRRPPRRAPPVRAPRPGAAPGARRRPGPRGVGAARPPARRRTTSRPRRDSALIGRDRELAVVERALLDAGGRARAARCSSPAPAGHGQVVAAGRASPHGRRSWACASATAPSAAGRGRVAVRRRWSRRSPTSAGGTRRCSTGWPTTHREEIDRALAGAETAWTGRQLAPAAVRRRRRAGRASPPATNGLLLTIDDVHDADDASLRLLHYLARSTRDQRVCIVLAHRPAPAATRWPRRAQSLLDRHGALELELGPLDRRRGRRARPPPRRRAAAPSWSSGSPRSAGASRSRSTSSPAGPADEPRWVQAPRRQHDRRASPPATREVLQRVAVVGLDVRHRRVRRAVRAARGGGLRPPRRRPRRAGRRAHRAPATGSATASSATRCSTTSRRTGAALIHRDAASRLVELGASPARIGHHLLAAGAGAEAVPYLLRAAETEAAVGAYRDALALVDAVRPHATGARPGDGAVAARRPAHRDRRPDGGVGLPRGARRRRARGRRARLRARLARSAVMSGDLETAAAALDGLETDGGATTPTSCWPAGKSRSSPSDFDAARRRPSEAQRLVLAGERNWQVLDLVALQGLLAHRRAVVRPHAHRAAPHPGEPGDRQRHLRRLPVRGRVPALRADAVRRGDRAGPRPAGDGRGAAARCGPRRSPRR